MTELSDRDLVERVLAQTDETAFTALIQRHYGAVQRRIYNLTQDWIEAQDLTQEVFLRVQTRLHTLKDPTRFAAWLDRIAHSACMDWHRKNRPDPVGDLLDETADHSVLGPLERLVKEEMLREIGVAMFDLPQHQRLPFVLYHFDQLRYEEIAAELKMSMGTVKSLIARARQRLRRALQSRELVEPAWSTIALDFTSLPSRQGWEYRTGFEFLPGGVPEKRAFSVSGGVLTLNNADIFPDNMACYVLKGVVDPHRPFVLSFRARKLREKARFPDFDVDPNPVVGPRPHRRNGGFEVGIMTGTRMVKLNIGTRQLLDSKGVLSSEIDNKQFHDYRLEGTPGAACKLYVDNQYISRCASQPHNATNRIILGDAGCTGGNAHVEITQFNFTQIHTVATASNNLIKASPFSSLGQIEHSSMLNPSFNSPTEAERALRNAIRKESRRWKIGPREPIQPRDFALH